MNDKASARRTVLISIVALLALNTYKGRLSTQDVTTTKRLWGTGVVGIMLSLLADVAPNVAGPFAALVVLGSLTNGGDKALQNLLGKASGRTIAPTAGSSSSPAPAPAPARAGLHTGP